MIAVTPKERDGRREKVVGVGDGDGGDIVVVLMIWVEVEKLKEMGVRGGVGCYKGGVGVEKKVAVVVNLKKMIKRRRWSWWWF